MHRSHIYDCNKKIVQTYVIIGYHNFLYLKKKSPFLRKV